jgi:hypothetical protein
MSRRLIVTGIAVAGLLVADSLTSWWKARRELQSVERELRAVTKANQALRKTLGEMTLAISAKDRQIDELLGTGCNRQESVPTPSQSRFPAGPIALTPGVDTLAKTR